MEVQELIDKWDHAGPDAMGHMAATIESMDDDELLELAHDFRENYERDGKWRVMYWDITRQLRNRGLLDKENKAEDPEENDV